MDQLVSLQATSIFTDSYPFNSSLKFEYMATRP